MRKIAAILFFIFLSSGISALCEEGQIDINSASVEELDEIIYIGPARAEQIISLRPFDSVDDLIRVSGIGEIYLSAIKEQNLACVAEEATEETNEESIEETAQEEEENSDSAQEESKAEETEKTKYKSENIYEEIKEESKAKNTFPEEREIITLNPQVIKTDESKNLNAGYALYGFIAVSIFVVILFLLKNRHKTEFE